MGFLENLLGSTQHQQDYQNFVDRYEQGPPHEGYSGQEVMDRYQQVAPNVPQDTYRQAAEEAFSRLTPEQRTQFVQHLQQQASDRGLNYPDLNRPTADERFQDPQFLAQTVSGMHQQQPGLLGQILGAVVEASEVKPRVAARHPSESCSPTRRPRLSWPG